MDQRYVIWRMKGDLLQGLRLCMLQYCCAIADSSPALFSSNSVFYIHNGSPWIVFNYKRGASPAFLLLGLCRATEWNGKTPDHGLQGETSRDESQTRRNWFEIYYFAAAFAGWCERGQLSSNLVAFLWIMNQFTPWLLSCCLWWTCDAMMTVLSPPDVMSPWWCVEKAETILITLS